METVFILGREPALSVAELEAVAPRWSARLEGVMPEAAILSHDRALPERAIDQLGGCVKQATVIAHWPVADDPLATVTTQFTWPWMSPLFPEGRVEFGVSVYGLSRRETTALVRHFMGIKSEIKKTDRPVRLVTSREPDLSAVVVDRNGLLKNGHEIILVRLGEEIIVGRTEAVQDFRGYSRRDYGRPAADPKSGMLPPKVAQIMVNLSGARPDQILLDPFCGSGTVLQEALLLGIRQVHGSDANGKAVKDAQANIRWLLKEFPQLHTVADVTLADVRGVTGSPDVIVTEPDLGKPLRGHEPLSFLQQEAQRLRHLYLEAFRRWNVLLKSDGCIVMIWPEFMVGDNNVAIDLAPDLHRLGFEPMALLSAPSAQALRWPNQFVLTYKRPAAKVRRQIRKWVKI